MSKAEVYGGSGPRVRPGWGEEALYQGGPALDALEPVNELPGELAGVGGGQVAQPLFMFAQAPSAALRSGASAFLPSGCPGRMTLVARLGL